MVKVIAFCSVASVLAKKDSAPDASVMLQLKQADALLGGSEASSPDHISALLEKHALDMVQSGVAPDYGEDSTLAQMEVTMATLISNIKSDIDDSQAVMTYHRNKVANWYQIDINGPKPTSLKNLKATAKTKHFECRDDEDVALEEEIAADGAVVAKWTAPIKAACDAEKVEELVGTTMWSPKNEGWGKKLDALVATAKVKQANADVYTGGPLAKQHINCNNMQRDFEDAWCAEKRGQDHGCDLIDAQEAYYEEQKQAFIKHSHMIQSAKKVTCFVKAIRDSIKEGPGKALDGAKVKACVELVYSQTPEVVADDTTLITVTYTDGDVISLDLTGPYQTCVRRTLVPGSDAWMKATGYADKNHRIIKRYQPVKKHCFPDDQVIVVDKVGQDLQ